MFKKNKIYKRSKIHDEYGGQRQGGISTPKEYNDIFIFTSNSGKDFGYEDGWVDDVTFKYTGEGQIGDMKFVRGNKAIRDHLENNKTIHLFEKAKDSYVKYVDEVYYTDHDIIKTKDKYDNLREAIQFTLKRLNSYEEQEMNKDDNKTKDLDKLRNKALNSSKTKSSKTNTTSTVHERSKAIKDYALVRADGNCELCDKVAPFEKDNGDLYLEVHHINKLSDNGPDHPSFVAAICPNCHAEAHYGKNKIDLKNILLNKIKAKESKYEI